MRTTKKSRYASEFIFESLRIFQFEEYQHSERVSRTANYETCGLIVKYPAIALGLTDSFHCFTNDVSSLKIG